jgi:hypothetical protein
MHITLTIDGVERLSASIETSGPDRIAAVAEQLAQLPKDKAWWIEVVTPQEARERVARAVVAVTPWIAAWGGSLHPAGGVRDDRIWENLRREILRRPPVRKELPKGYRFHFSAPPVTTPRIALTLVFLLALLQAETEATSRISVLADWGDFSDHEQARRILMRLKPERIRRFLPGETDREVAVTAWRTAGLFSGVLTQRRAGPGRPRLPEGLRRERERAKKRRRRRPIQPFAALPD